VEERRVEENEMKNFARLCLLLLGVAALATALTSAQGVVSIPKPVPGWVDIVNAAKPHTVFLLGPGEFHTSVPITISASFVVLAGAGARTTTIIADAAMPALIDSTSRIISFRDIVVNANHMADVAIRAVMPTAGDTKALDGVYAENAVKDGIVLVACQGCTLTGVWSARNGRDGIVLAGCNGSIALGISSMWNGGRGIVLKKSFTNGVNFSGGMTLLGPNSEENNSTQIEIVDTSTAVLIENPWIEGSSVETDGILIRAPHVTILGGRISGKNAEGNSAAVHLVGDGKDAHIGGNLQMENEVPVGNFARIAK
jgi:hypothetical protein